MTEKTYLSNITSRFTWTAFGDGPRNLQEQALYRHFEISEFLYMMNHSEDVARSDAYESRHGHVSAAPARTDRSVL
jgi:hypothetical protein